jgi:hypothetical protein
METKTKEGWHLVGKEARGRETFHPAKRKVTNKSKHSALKLQRNISVPTLLSTHVMYLPVFNIEERCKFVPLGHKLFTN